MIKLSKTVICLRKGPNGGGGGEAGPQHHSAEWDSVKPAQARQEWGGGGQTDSRLLPPLPSSRPTCDLLLEECLAATHYSAAV